jgi:lipopolysaccharide/colanic/teichoic acid biosynthesis glycosyltransferase
MPSLSLNPCSADRQTINWHGEIRGALAGIPAGARKPPQTVKSGGFSLQHTRGIAELLPLPALCPRPDRETILRTCAGAAKAQRDALVASSNPKRLRSASLVVKRLIDVLGSALTLFFCSPLLAAIAVLIQIDSKGPVFYGAQRVGKDGRLFRCYKLRTMVPEADALKPSLRRNNERSGPVFKIARDPRITRVGRYLRRYSLDELPQLWNVLQGEMSLVGPRPHPLDDVAAYEAEHLTRLGVIPGITGLWQVTARRDPSFDRLMQLDREYIRSWSLGLDVRILLRTVLAVVHGSGD